MSLSLPASLTQEGASSCLDQLTAALSTQSQSVVLDASALRRFDSSVLAVLIEVRRRAQRSGVQLQIAFPPDRLLSLASLYGVAELIFPSDESAGPS